MEDIAIELSLLHSLAGIQFVKQLEKITQYGGFTLIKGEVAIYSVGGEYEKAAPYMMQPFIQMEQYL